MTCHLSPTGIPGRLGPTTGMSKHTAIGTYTVVCVKSLIIAQARIAVGLGVYLGALMGVNRIAN